MDDIDGLRERLERKAYAREEMHNNYGMIDMPCDADDFGAEEYLVNPDGPQASAALAQLQAENERLRFELASAWRNAITNTIALADQVRARHRPAARNKAHTAVDAALNDQFEKWFSFSRGVSPTDYEQAEAEWQRFMALPGRAALQPKDTPA